MALVNICDICGKKITATKYAVIIKRIALTNKTYDLCPDCITKMTEWIKENKNE